MAKNKDIFPFLLLGGAGLMLLRSNSKSKESAPSGRTPPAPPGIPGRGGAPPPAQSTPGSGVPAEYREGLLFLGYNANVNVNTATVAFQKDYNRYLDLIGGQGERLDQDGDYGTKTAQALGSIIYALGFDRDTWRQALSGIYSALEINGDEDVSLFSSGRHDHFDSGSSSFLTKQEVMDARRRAISPSVAAQFDANTMSPQELLMTINAVASGGSISPGKRWTYTPVPRKRSNDPDPVTPHIHFFEVSDGDIKSLASGDALTFKSTNGYETASSGTESHSHTVILRAVK